MRVFFCVGEASGDAYAAEILKQLQPLRLGRLRSMFAEYRHDLGNPSDEQLLQSLHSDSGQVSDLNLVELLMDFQKEFGEDLSASTMSDEDLATILSNLLVEKTSPNDIAFQAVGGRKLAAAGARIIADSTKWGALGIFEALKVYPRVILDFYKAKRELKRGRPGLFIPIDFGYANILLSRHAKNWGWQVLYFIPPGSWRKNKQGADLPAVTDAIVTPFPWSAEMLNEMGAKAHYFGHPLKEMVERVPDAAERTGIAVLPGSRTHEIESNVPVIAHAIKDMEGPVRIAVAPNADEEAIKKEWMKWSDHDLILSRNTYEVLKSSRSGIVCSGTATLEAALCGCPCVVMYRGTWIMEIEYRIRRPKFEYISLPNILLDRPLLKELIQWDATPDNVRSELEDIHKDGPRREEVLSAYREIYKSLGSTDCIERTAELAKTLFPV